MLKRLKLQSLPPSVRKWETSYVNGPFLPKVPPWGAILRSPGVLSLSFGHLAANWGAYQLLTLMPTYFNEILG